LRRPSHTPWRYRGPSGRSWAQGPTFVRGNLSCSTAAGRREEPEREHEQPPCASPLRPHRAGTAEDAAASAGGATGNAGHGGNDAVWLAVVLDQAKLVLAAVDELAGIGGAQTGGVQAHHARWARDAGTSFGTAIAGGGIAEEVTRTKARACRLQARALGAHLGRATRHTRAALHAGAGVAELTRATGLPLARIHDALARDTAQSCRTTLGVAVHARAILAGRARQAIDERAGVDASSVGLTNLACGARLPRAGLDQARPVDARPVIGTGIEFAALDASPHAFPADADVSR